MTEARAPSTVLFDLDGTFADTLPDLSHALAQALEERKLAPAPAGVLRPLVSRGARAMAKKACGDIVDEEALDGLVARFLAVYGANGCRHTRLVDGMQALVDELHRRAIPWGIVTNKPGWLTDPLLRTLGLYERAACVVSGDTLERRKPHPQPLLHAFALAGCEPAQSVFIGDDARDIEAGNAAGAGTLVARYGYIDADERPDEWGADGSIDHPLDLIAMLEAAG